MAHLDENFLYQVLDAVSEIPKGKVATYGQIARLIGKDKNARLVGKALQQSSLYTDGYPCYRVVNSAGRLVPRWNEQESQLRVEGVTFKKIGHVDMKKHQWDA